MSNVQAPNPYARSIVGWLAKKVIDKTSEIVTGEPFFEEDDNDKKIHDIKIKPPVCY